MTRTAVIYFLIGLAGVIVYGLLDPQSLPFPKCPFLSLTGLQCPGCGSQRAVHQLLHGHFYNAFQLNALLLPALLYAIAGYGVALLSPDAWPAIRQQYFGIRAAWISLAIIIVFWVARNVY